MADRYYSIPNPSQKEPHQVVEGAAATPANWIDLRVTYDATGASRQAVYDAIRALERAILQDNFPPV